MFMAFYLLFSVCQSTHLGVSSSPQDKSAYWKTIFIITHPKHMLLVLKEQSSFEHPKQMFKLMGKKIFKIYAHKFFLSGSMSSIQRVNLLLIKFQAFCQNQHLYNGKHLNRLVKKNKHNAFFARGDFVIKLITFANSLDPDKD